MCAKQKVYISSTYNDLKDFRRNLISFFEKEAHEDFEICRIMEHMYDDGSDTPFISECLEEVSQSDVYIIILGNRVGSYPPNDKTRTYVEQEYEEAVRGRKKIIRLIHTPFEPEKCDDVEKYKQFVSHFEGRFIHPFSDIKEFEIEYLKVLYALKSGNNPKLSEEELLSSIDRKWQVDSFNRRLYMPPARNVLYYYYFSCRNDFSHLLNFRISNNLLHSRIFRFMEEYFVSLEAFKRSNNREEITGYFTQGIALKSFGDEGWTIGTIEGLFELLNQRDDLKCLVVPVRMCHSLDTEGKMHEKICSVLEQFSQPELSDRLNGKKVIFLLNIEFVSDEVLKKKSEKIGRYLSGRLNAFDMGELEPLTGDTIGEWIREYIDSNPSNADRYLKQYFKMSEPRRMDVVVEEAKAFVMEKYISNI